MEQNKFFETNEKKIKPTITVPAGWGKGCLTPDIELMLIRDSDTIKKEAEDRLLVDTEMRKVMDELGFNVIDIDYGNSSSYKKNETEFVIKGRLSDIGDELSQIKEAIPDIKIPKTLTPEQFSKNLFFPAVASFEYSSQGNGKYLLENNDQWNLFQTFLKNEGKQVESAFLIKEFIPTPSEKYTSYRVITSAKGTIMASSLLYSKNEKSDPEFIEKGYDPNLGRPGFNILNYLECENSDYFLNSKKIISNVGSDGNCIPLDPEESSCEISKEEQNILQEHNIKNAKLPQEIAEQAKIIGSSLGKKMGLFVGIDFIQDEKNNFYYLETNAEPGIKTYLAVKNGGAGENIDGYRMLMKEALTDLASEDNAT